MENRTYFSRTGKNKFFIMKKDASPTFHSFIRNERGKISLSELHHKNLVGWYTDGKSNLFFPNLEK